MVYTCIHLSTALENVLLFQTNKMAFESETDVDSSKHYANLNSTWKASWKAIHHAFATINCWFYSKIRSTTSDFPFMKIHGMSCKNVAVDIDAEIESISFSINENTARMSCCVPFELLLYRISAAGFDQTSPKKNVQHKSAILGPYLRIAN